MTVLSKPIPITPTSLNSDWLKIPLQSFIGKRLSIKDNRRKFIEKKVGIEFSHLFSVPPIPRMKGLWKKSLFTSGHFVKMI